MAEPLDTRNALKQQLKGAVLHDPHERTWLFCEMLKRAQQGDAFFAGAENHACEAGLYALGQADAPEPFINGEFGAGGGKAGL